MLKSVVLYTLAALGALFIFLVLYNPLHFNNAHIIVHKPDHISYSQLLKLKSQGNIKHASLSGNVITIKTDKNQFFQTHIINEGDLVKQLIAKGASIEISPVQDKSPALLEITISWLPILFMLLTIWISFSRPLGHIEKRMKSIEEKLFDETK